MHIQADFPKQLEDRTNQPKHANADKKLQKKNTNEIFKNEVCILGDILKPISNKNQILQLFILT